MYVWAQHRWRLLMSGRWRRGKRRPMRGFWPNPRIARRSCGFWIRKSERDWWSER